MRDEIRMKRHNNQMLMSKQTSGSPLGRWDSGKELLFSGVARGFVTIYVLKLLSFQDSTEVFMDEI